MQALILAADAENKHNYHFSSNEMQDCLTPVNGVPLLERMLRQLDGRGLSRIMIAARSECGARIETLRNDLNLRTEILVYSCTREEASCADLLNFYSDVLGEDDLLFLDADCIFDDSVLERILEDPRDPVVLADCYREWQEGICVSLKDGEKISGIFPEKDFDGPGPCFRTTGIWKFGRQAAREVFAPAVRKASQAGEDLYDVLAYAVDSGCEIFVSLLSGEWWYAVRDRLDLDVAESMFAEDSDLQLKKFNSRFGGYWRYPHLLDYCYLVNPYFPPKRLLQEMQENFEELLKQYPSGMRVNTLLAAGNAGIRAENFVIGNGSSELIKAAMEYFRGKTGVVRPTFEEYANRYPEADIVCFRPENDDFSYDAKALIGFFAGKGLSNLILINPDNPSGNLLREKDLSELLEWSASENIRLLVDESFFDFSDYPEESILRQEVLDRYPNLCVIKSISKSYGVPGIRLGFLASSDEELIRALKAEASIWNINSFAEFFMQIIGKYEKDYREALVKFREERRRYAAELEKVPGLRLIPTEANYFMAEFAGVGTAKAIQKELLMKYGILIKDVTSKVKVSDRQFVRLTVRNAEENDRLVRALTEVMARRIKENL